MNATVIDRIGVALIVYAASAYLARRVAQRVASAFGRGKTSAGACGPECGCGNDSVTDSRSLPNE